jgi:hypothetical protein
MQEKIKKMFTLLSVLIIALTAGCYSPAGTCKKEISIPATRPAEKTSNWYSVEFSKYDQEKISKIYNDILNNKAYRVQVSYDKNTQLANEIKRNLQKEINYLILMQPNQKNLSHNVTVTVYGYPKDKN